MPDYRSVINENFMQQKDNRFNHPLAGIRFQGNNENNCTEATYSSQRSVKNSKMIQFATMSVDFKIGKYLSITMPCSDDTIKDHIENRISIMQDPFADYNARGEMPLPNEHSFVYEVIQDITNDILNLRLFTRGVILLIDPADANKNWEFTKIALQRIILEISNKEIYYVSRLVNIGFKLHNQQYVDVDVETVLEVAHMAALMVGCLLYPGLCNTIIMLDSGISSTFRLLEDIKELKDFLDDGDLGYFSTTEIGGINENYDEI